jgi:hypothetical protein
MHALPRVAQCLTIAGDIDYVVVIRSRDVAHYQEFARQVFATAPGIRSYTSEIVLAVSKWSRWGRSTVTPDCARSGMFLSPTKRRGSRSLMIYLNMRGGRLPNDRPRSGRNAGGAG